MFPNHTKMRSHFQRPVSRGMLSEELNAPWDNEIYELTPVPEGRTSVGGKWVYAVKLGPNGEEKY